MLWYKAWRESRVRFLLSAALISSMCLAYTLLASRLYPELVHQNPRIHNYIQYVHWNVFGGVTRGVLQLSCLLLGLGGLQRDRKQNTLGFTLALPISRTHLVITRAMVGFLQIVVISSLPPLLITTSSYCLHQQLPLSYGLPFVPLWAIGGFFTFAVSFFFSAVFWSEYVALVVAYVGYMFYLAGTRHPRVADYHLHVADFMSGLSSHQLDQDTMLWTGSYPLSPILGFFLVGVIFVVVAALITTRQDL